MASSFFPSLKEDLEAPPTGAAAFFPSITETLPEFPKPSPTPTDTTSVTPPPAASFSSISSGPIVKRSAFSSTSNPASAASAAAASSSSGPNRQIVQSTSNPNVSLVKSGPVEFETQQCPTCPGSEVIVDPHQGVEVCTNCGVVLGNYISEESEWRTFSDRRGEDPNRVGGPEIGLIADAGLATLMGDNPTGMSTNLARIQNKSALSSHHRQLMEAFRTAGQICSKLCLPESVSNRACTLFKNVYEKKAIRPKNSDTLVAACVLWVCKVDHNPITLKEMSGVSDVSKTDIGRCFKEIKHLHFHKSVQASGEEEEKDSKMSHINRWGNMLKLGPKYIGHAKDIARAVLEVEHSLGSREHASIAGAVLFIVSHYGPPQNRRPLKAVSKIVQISENTIKDVTDIILKHRLSVIPQEFQAIPIEFK